MRVLLVHNRYRSESPSGENAVVDDESRLLAAAGCTVERLEVDSDDIAGWSAQKKATLPLRAVWSRDGRRLVHDAIDKFRPDVVHFHNTFPLLSPAAIRTAHQCGVGVVLTLHNFRSLCPSGMFLRDGRICESCLGRVPIPAVRHGCYRGSVAATVPVATMNVVHRGLGTWHHCVDRLVCPSEFTRGKYLEAGWPADRLVVKPNTAKDAGLIRRGPGNGFLYLGRLSEGKGVEGLIMAWRHAFPVGEQRLTIAGSGELDADLRAAAAGAAGVTFVGRVDRETASKLLAEARALVVPSTSYEVFPRTIVEGCAAGTAIIGSRRGAITEIVEHETMGLLVEPNSLDDLASALKRLAASDELAIALGAGARQAYETRFGPAVTTARLLDIYHDAVAARSSAPAGAPELVAG